jgi:pimeloyl-ACP methyl ester carboxylesterase
VAWPVRIDTGDAALAGDLAVPDRPRGLVIFAHGSGSSRHSPRNRAVADGLGRARLATLLVDLLTHAEEEIDDVTAELRFDIPFLTRRVVATIDWAWAHQATATLPVGLFGASTGAAAALAAAAERPQVVKAVVSRGGRPDLAGPALEIVTAPTLLIVGGEDTAVIALNREALVRLTCVQKLQIVPGATHLFEEPGALGAVTTLATDWFLEYLP